MTVEGRSRPRLPARVRLRWDPARSSHLLLAPEAVVTLNPSAAEVLSLCDGVRTVTEITEALGAAHPDIPREQLGSDVLSLLSALSARAYVTWAE